MGGRAVVAATEQDFGSGALQPAAHQPLVKPLEVLGRFPQGRPGGLCPTHFAFGEVNEEQVDARLNGGDGKGGPGRQFGAFLVASPSLVEGVDVAEDTTEDVHRPSGEGQDGSEFQPESDDRLEEGQRLLGSPGARQTKGHLAGREEELIAVIQLPGEVVTSATVGDRLVVMAEEIRLQAGHSQAESQIRCLLFDGPDRQRPFSDRQRLGRLPGEVDAGAQEGESGTEEIVESFGFCRVHCLPAVEEGAVGVMEGVRRRGLGR